jgi:hypothetical protein
LFVWHLLNVGQDFVRRVLVLLAFMSLFSREPYSMI